MSTSAVATYPAMSDPSFKNVRQAYLAVSARRDDRQICRWRGILGIGLNFGNRFSLKYVGPMATVPGKYFFALLPVPELYQMIIGAGKKMVSIGSKTESINTPVVAF
jgi:hypothetical protein